MVSPPLIRRRYRRAAVFHRDAAERIVLPPWMAPPVVGHLDPGQRGVTVEDQPEEVPRLALVPVAGGIDVHQRRHVRVSIGCAYLKAHPAVVSDREEVVDGPQLSAFLIWVVHA